MGLSGDGVMGYEVMGCGAVTGDGWGYGAGAVGQ